MMLYKDPTRWIQGTDAVEPHMEHLTRLLKAAERRATKHSKSRRHKRLKEVLRGA